MSEAGRAGLIRRARSSRTSTALGAAGAGQGPPDSADGRLGGPDLVRDLVVWPKPASVAVAPAAMRRGRRLHVEFS